MKYIDHSSLSHDGSCFLPQIIIAETGMFPYCWCSVILFSFPKFCRVVLLFQTCSTSEFVCDHAFFCVYVYLWIYLPHMRENMWPLSFWAWLTSLSMMSSNCKNSQSFLSMCDKWISFGRLVLYVFQVRLSSLKNLIAFAL
jgi:hypothetical protein